MSAMRDCDSFAEDLSAFVDDELDAARVAEIHVHLVTCAACAQVIARLRSADDALSAFAARSTHAEASRVESVRSALAAQIAAEDAPPQRRMLPSQRVPRRSRSWLAPFASGAAAASVAAMLLWFGTAPDATQPEIAAMAIESPPAADTMEAAKARVVLQEPDAFAGRGASAPAGESADQAPPPEGTAALEIESADALALIERMAALSDAERAELIRDVERWRGMSEGEREAMRERWSGASAR